MAGLGLPELSGKPGRAAMQRIKKLILERMIITNVPVGIEVQKHDLQHDPGRRF